MASHSVMAMVLSAQEMENSYEIMQENNGALLSLGRATCLLCGGHGPWSFPEALLSEGCGKCSPLPTLALPSVVTPCTGLWRWVGDCKEGLW